MSWTFDHFDSHFPWKQFNQLGSGETLAKRETRVERAPTFPSSPLTDSPHFLLLLVRSDGQPVYEQREQ